MTAEPARASAAAGEPDPDEHDPRARGWADVRQGLVDGTSLVVLTVARLAARDPGDAEALRIAELAIASLDRWGEIGRRWVVDDAFLARMERRAEERERRAYEQGAADCKAARCRLEVVRGG